MLSDLDRIPTIAPDVVGKMIDNEGVLVQTSQAQVKVVNEVGAFIWFQIDGKRSIREITNKVSQFYEVEPDQAQADAIEFIGFLLQRGLIEFCG